MKIKYNGLEYILVEDAHICSDSSYEALAIREGDSIDLDGYQSVYRVTWSILPDYNPVDNDESGACDWEHPETVEKSNIEYNATNKQFA